MQTNPFSVIKDDKQPLGTIALTLSGGGVRAAGFHLGTMAYLSRLDLLKDVETISSVSGGSFVNAKYSMMVARAPQGEIPEETFRRFYFEFFDYSLNANLVPRALKMLGTTPGENSRRRDMSTALADVYNEADYLDGFLFGDLWGRPDMHLKNIIFNATEFKTGLAFRFHKAPGIGRCGSLKVPVSDYYARKARLADIVASSSCIPTGLEPIVFPDDYRWPDPENQTRAEISAEMTASSGVGSVVLMDGGVYDNQGIEAVLVVLRGAVNVQDLGDPEYITNRHLMQAAQIRHSEKEKSLGVLIVSDTPVIDESLYSPQPLPKRGKMTLQSLNLASLGVMWLCASSLLVNFYHLLDDLREDKSMLEYFRTFSSQSLFSFMRQMDLDNQLSYVVPMLLAFGVGGFIFYVRHRIKSLRSLAPGVLDGCWQHLKKCRLTDVMDMMKSRLSSTWVMSVDIFFNRIRALGYSLLLNDEELRKKTITHEIYDLAITAVNEPSCKPPTAQMIAPVRRSMSMGTQIWISSEGQLNDLMATGMCTMCYNLIRYIEDKRTAEPNYADQVYQQALKDWDELLEDPFIFIKQMKALRSETPEAQPAVAAKSRSQTA